MELHRIENNHNTKKRIWELDWLRGVAIFVMLFIHYLYLNTVVGTGHTEFLGFWYFLKFYGGDIFVLISGICITLGHNSARRGIIVLGCGFILTILTFTLVNSGFESEEILIQWGVLHCLGASMLIYPLFKKLNIPLTAAVSMVIIALGHYFERNVRLETALLLPIGIRPYGFVSFDYFALCPIFGCFLIGTILGRTVYKEKISRLPMVDDSRIWVKIFSFIGRNSLWFYMIHLPLFYIIIKLTC